MYFQYEYRDLSPKTVLYELSMEAVSANAEKNNTSIASIVSFLNSSLKKKLDAIAASGDHQLFETPIKGDITSIPSFTAHLKTLDSLRLISAQAEGSHNKNLHEILEILDRALVIFQDKGALVESCKRSETAAVIVQVNIIGFFAVINETIASCLIYMENPDGTGRFIIDEVGVNKVMNQFCFKSLKNFVKTVEKYGLKKALYESAKYGDKSEVLLEFAFAIGASLLALSVVLGLLFFARDIIEYYYQIRRDTSKWLNLQALFLEINANRLSPEMNKVKAKQLNYAARFRTMASAVRVDSDKANSNAAPLVETNNKEITAIVDQTPSSASQQYI